MCCMHPFIIYKGMPTSSNSFCRLCLGCDKLLFHQINIAWLRHAFCLPLSPKHRVLLFLSFPFNLWSYFIAPLFNGYFDQSLCIYLYFLLLLFCFLVCGRKCDALIWLNRHRSHQEERISLRVEGHRRYLRKQYSGVLRKLSAV